MTSEETTEALRKAAKIGLTAAQAAEMIGITAPTARRKAKKAGFAFTPAIRGYPAAIRDEQIVTQKKADKKKAAQQYQKRIEAIKKEAAEISCPLERREMIYGAALLAFEKRQAANGNRPQLPCDRPEPAPKGRRKRNSGYNWQPVEVDGIKFDSRSCAADALGVTRSEFSAMLSENASPFRRAKLARLLNEYRGKPSRG